MESNAKKPGRREQSPASPTDPADDWSNPGSHRQLNPLVPLGIIGGGVLLVILYGLFAG